jgi:hypothetical protein
MDLTGSSLSLKVRQQNGNSNNFENPLQVKPSLKVHKAVDFL